MCQMVLVNRGEIEIGTVKQFKEYFKVDVLIPDDAYDVVMDDCCLCQIDIEAELKKLNVPFVFDYCDYYVGEGLQEIEV